MQMQIKCCLLNHTYYHGVNANYHKYNFRNVCTVSCSPIFNYVLYCYFQNVFYNKCHGMNKKPCSVYSALKFQKKFSNMCV